MKFTDLFIRRPVLALVVNLLIIIAGLQAVRSINVRQYPRSDNAAVTVTTVYVGASPELVRGFITTPLERVIAAAEGIDYIQSQSAQGLSTISVRLKINYDPIKALSEISSKVDQVRGDLPPEAEVPIINVESADSQFASAYLSFTSDILRQNQITDYLVRVVQPRLSSVGGVQRAEILGARTFAMRIWLKPERMAAYGISPVQVRQALAANNFLAAVGQTKGALVQVNLTANTDLRSVPEFKRMVVRERDGAVVRLEDIAEVVLGAEDYDTEVRFSGQTAVFMGIWPLPTANSIDVIQRIRAEMDGIQAQLPSGMQARVAYDATDYITNAIHEVVRTLGDTLVIVVIVIFLFLGSLRSVLIPVVAIPLSLVGAVFLMQVFGFTLNLLTLLAVVLSVGLVVDDAIVVVENVERHLQEGLSPLEAALRGARELVGPIIAMTVTLAAVYAPIGLQGGLTGSLFREFAFTLAGAVVISGVVALTLSPMMSSRLLTAGMTEHGLAGRINRDFKRFSAFYGRLLNATLDARPAVYLVWAVVSLLAIPMYIMAPKELAPTEDQGVIFGIIDASADATIDQTSRFTAAVNQAYFSIPETQFSFQITRPSSGIAGMVVKPWGERQRTIFSILPEVQEKVREIPGIRTLPVLPPALPGGGQFPVEVVIASTAEAEQILQFARELQVKAVQSRMFAFPPVIDVKIDQPQSEIVIDRDKAAEIGLDLQQVGQDLAAMIGGNFVNRFDIAGRSYKVIPQIQRADRINPDQLKSIYITGPGGQLVPAQHHRDPQGLHRPALAQPLPAAERGQDQRGFGAAPRRGAAVPRGTGRGPPAQGLRGGLHRRVAPAALRGQHLPDHLRAGRRSDLPGPGGPVQQLPRPLRHPGRFRAARHVRRPRVHVPADAGPERRLLDPGVDHHAQHLLPDRPGDPGRPRLQERHPHRRVRQHDAGGRPVQARRRAPGRDHPAAADPDDDRGHHRRALPADARDRRRGRRRATASVWCWWAAWRSAPSSPSS